MIYPNWLMNNKKVSENNGYGLIEIEEGWQMITVPIKTGYWDKISHKHIHDGITIAKIKNYIIDQIEDKLGIDANLAIEIANTYTGDNQFFYNYIPGFTKDNSEHNFKLVYSDLTNEGKEAQEYTAFWIKSIHTEPFSIEWGEK